MRSNFTDSKSLSKLFFTSDLHFGHEAIIRFCNRPYGSAEHMNQELIRNWNIVVPKDGHIFILGDLSFLKQDETGKILSKLNGIKYLLIGNHDKQPRIDKLAKYFVGGMEYYHELYLDKNKAVLCHYPLRSWHGMGAGSWNLHGHCHGNIKPLGKQLDVGVDMHNYGPISYWDIKRYMDKRDIETLDHHRKEDTEV